MALVVVRICGDSPKEESVVWSLLGIIRLSLLPENQSQSTPDSVGRLFTQPHKSISKSQKPERNKRCTDTHSMRPYETCSNTPIPLPLFPWSLTCRGTGTIQDSEVVNSDVSPWSVPSNRLKNHLSEKKNHLRNTTTNYFKIEHMRWVEL